MGGRDFGSCLSFYVKRTNEKRMGWAVQGGGKNGRLDSGSKCAAAARARDRPHSQCFLMKTLLKASSSAAGYGGRCSCSDGSCALRTTMSSLYVFPSTLYCPSHPFLILFSDLLPAKRKPPDGDFLYILLSLFWYLPEFFTLSTR